VNGEYSINTKEFLLDSLEKRKAKYLKLSALDPNIKYKLEEVESIIDLVKFVSGVSNRLGIDWDRELKPIKHRKG